MSDEVILNDWNPSEETLLRWAFDENLLLSDQDEDLILHREEYLPLLYQYCWRINVPEGRLHIVVPRFLSHVLDSSRHGRSPRRSERRRASGR
jgi:hypothetical protein